MDAAARRDGVNLLDTLQFLNRNLRHEQRLLLNLGSAVTRPITFSYTNNFLTDPLRGSYAFRGFLVTDRVYRQKLDRIVTSARRLDSQCP